MTQILFTVDEVAEMLHLGRTKVYDLLRSGDIRSVRIGSARRIPVDALQAFVDKLAAGTTP